MRLDAFGTVPSGMADYLSSYGWHFSKKMCEWAVSRMFKIDGGSKRKIAAYTKESLEQLFDRWAVDVDDAYIYDALYVANMCKADFLGSSVADEQRLAYFVKDTLEDCDAYDGMVFTRFYADCVGSGTPIHWDDLI